MNETRTWIADLLAHFSGQENTIVIPRPYILITGSIEAALILNQIVYWSDRTSMDNGWFAKSYKQWEDETTLSKRQVSRAIPALRRVGVETKIRRFSGSPTLHYRLNKEKFVQSITTLLNNGKLQNVTIESDKKLHSSTEITTEITTTIPKGKKNSKLPAEVIFRQEWEANATLGNALLQAFGLDFVPATNQSRSSLEPYLEIAKELTIAGATVEQIPLLKTYIAKRSKTEEWSKKYSVKVFSRYYTEFLKTQNAKKIIQDDLQPQPEILSVFQQIEREKERKALENG